MNSKTTVRTLTRLGLSATLGCAASEPLPREHASAGNASRQQGSEAAPADPDAHAREWRSAGHDLHNTRHQALERDIDARNAGRLGVKWVFETKGDVWATAAVDATRVYVPDAAGNLYAVDRQTGALHWSRKVAAYTGVPDVIARSTPAVSDDALFLGDQGGRALLGASVFAVDKATGNRLWATKVDDHFAAVITASPIVHVDRVYVGVSSVEEVIAAGLPGYPCCSFRGSVVALDRRSGKIVWKTYTVPGRETPGYAGGAVWSGTPALDTARGALYVTTGNDYVAPAAALDCQSLATPAEIDTCVREVPGWEHNHFDAIVALDLATGKVKWAHAGLPFDVWNGACVAIVAGNEKSCPRPTGPDHDFGNGAILFQATIDGRARDLVGAGQKTGVYWAVDPDDGAVVWKTQVGPGGMIGGLEWGSAFDGQRIYTAVSNSEAKRHRLSSGAETTGGFWAALDPATGAVLWKTGGTPQTLTMNQGPLSVANGVVYAGTIDAVGTMYALEAATGRTLWTFASGGSVNSSPAIVDGTLFWGSGYGVPGFGITTNDKLYAFALDANALPPVPDAGTAPDVASPPDLDGSEPRWRTLFARYLAAGTVGHCQNCHGEMLTAASAHAYLTTTGQLGGAASALVSPGRSRLTWFGGRMPPGGPVEHPEARRDLETWVAAGALNN